MLPSASLPAFVRLHGDAHAVEFRQPEALRGRRTGDGARDEPKNGAAAMPAASGRTRACLPSAQRRAQKIPFRLIC